MAMGSEQSSDLLRSEMNVTPLIDVLLVLLIIFMVIAPEVPRGLAANLPQRSANVNRKPDGPPVLVRIVRDRSGEPRYQLNQRAVSMSELETSLSSALSTRAEKVMFIQAEEELEFSAVAAVMDLGRRAGANHIGLLTSKSAD